MRLPALRVVMMQDEETRRWLVRCVDYDIVASGKTISEAREAFIGVLALQIIGDLQDGLQPFSRCHPAPDVVRERFEAGEQLGQSPRPLSLPVPADMRALIPSGERLEAEFQELRIWG